MCNNVRYLFIFKALLAKFKDIHLAVDLIEEPRFIHATKKPIKKATHECTFGLLFTNIRCHMWASHCRVRKH